MEVEAKGRGLPVIDATCPLVSKVHKEGHNHAKRGRRVVDRSRGPPRGRGHKGRIPGSVHIVSTPNDVAALRMGNGGGLAYVTQTTLSVDDTRDVIDAADPVSVWWVRMSRTSVTPQIASHRFARLPGSWTSCWLLAGNSSNSNRLRARRRGDIPSYLIDDASQFNPDWLEGVGAIGVTGRVGAGSVDRRVDRPFESLWRS